MQEAKKYEGWNVTHTVPYEALNVSESDERSSSLYACIPVHHPVKSCPLEVHFYVGPTRQSL
jgi:hypothetical protein